MKDVFDNLVSFEGDGRVLTSIATDMNGLQIFKIVCAAEDFRPAVINVDIC